MQLKCGPLVALPLVLLSACSLAPHYVRPEPVIASTYPQGPGYGAPGQVSEAVASDLGWRNVLVDPRLQQLVEIALQNNPDLRLALLNVQELQTGLRLQTSALFPQISAVAGRSRSRTPADLSRVGAPEVLGSYSVSASTGWEIDIFGKLRSLRQAALQRYLASAQGRKAAQILIISQLAGQYLAVLACDELLEVTNQTLASARLSFDLVKLQFDTGAGGELEVRQAETVVRQAEANRAAQLRARAQAHNGLVLLLGQPEPAGMQRGQRLVEQGILEDLPAGIPSDLLVRRPDVLQAEALLRAANADVGAARAAFFPVIDMTGTAGTASARLTGLFKAGSAAWTFAPALALPVFNAGANRANLAAARLRMQAAITQYQQTVQAAFREVADGLAARGSFTEQISALEKLAFAQQRRFDLALLLFRNGESSYLDVLTAQEDLYDSQLVLVSARLQRLVNLVDLYRALGGGWLEHTADTPQSAAAR